MRPRKPLRTAWNVLVKRAPLEAQLIITRRCNLSCGYCAEYDRASAPVPCEIICERIDDLHRMNTLLISLLGGEPLIHPDVARIVAHAREHSLVNIITNGWSFTEETLEQARFAGLVNVAFSLDGFKEAHDRIRRQGSFDRVMSAIDICRAASTPVSVVSHINALNYKVLPDLRELLGQRGVGSWQLQLGNPEGAMGENRELVIPSEDLLWLIPLIAEMREDETRRPRLFAGDNIGYYGTCEPALRDSGGRISWWVGCRAGCQVIGIESNGNIKGCLSLPSARHGEDLFSEGSLRDRSMAEIWSGRGAFSLMPLLIALLVCLCAAASTFVVVLRRPALVRVMTRRRRASVQHVSRAAGGRWHTL